MMPYQPAPAARVLSGRRAAVLVAAGLAVAHMLGGGASSAQAAFEAPAGYYDSAAGLNGAALRARLRTVMSTGHVQTSYDEARYILDDTDDDPNNPGRLLTAYDRASIADPWTNGATWNREHVWPASRGLGSSTGGGAYSDVHMLKPANAATNSDRGNLSFGGLGVAYTGPASGGKVTRGGLDYYYAGTADEGDVARIAAYTATRWTTQNSALNVVNGQGSTGASTLGDLAALTRWHYRDVPDAFELRRNDAIYWGDRKYDIDEIDFDGTNNRNAFIDRPEYFWSVFQNNTNDAQLRVGGAAANADGSSRVDLNLGRVIVGATAPSAQTVTLNKAGLDGVYYNVSTTGSATSSVTGRYNAFENYAASEAGTGTQPATLRNLTVGLSTATATAGLKSGQVIVDNLDVTDGRGTGFGSLDGNDVVDLSLAVLDHSEASFASASNVDALTLDFGTVKVGDSAVQSVSLFNLVSLADYTASLDLDQITGSGDTGKFTLTLDSFRDLLAGGSRAFDAILNTSAAGSFGATYLLAVSDEDIAGATNGTSLALTLSGTVVAVPEPMAGLMLLAAGGFFAARRRGR